MGDIFKCNIKGLKLNKGKFVKSFDAAMKVQTRQAARAWLREIIEHVPVYSGMSIASLLPLGGYLHVAIPITPHPNFYNHRYAGEFNGIAAGQAEGGYAFIDNNFKYTFTFSTEVKQFIINDINVGLGMPPLLNPTPWRATELAGVAFKEYLDNNLKNRVPKISDFVYIETIG